jgi:molecular chaperone GrpE
MPADTHENAALATEVSSAASVGLGHDESLAALQRCQADFANYRKRTEHEAASRADAATGDLVRVILPVLDALDLAQEHGDGDGSSLEPVLRLLVDSLAAAGLTRLGAPGDPFDPTVHDAVEHIILDDPAPGSTVVQVLRSGYRWRSTLLRPAMVSVGESDG